MTTQTCAVCYENIENDGVETPCGHTFHNSCLTHWLISKTSCPMCRFQIGECEFEEEYFSDEEEIDYTFDVSFNSDRIGILNPFLEERVYTEAANIVYETDEIEEMEKYWKDNDGYKITSFNIRKNNECVNVLITKDEEYGIVFLDIENKFYKQMNKKNNKVRNNNYIFKNYNSIKHMFRNPLKQY